MKAIIRSIMADDDLRASLLYTLAYLFLFRVGLFILLPVIDPGILVVARSGLFDPTGRQDLSLYSILALGVGPYYLASVLSPILLLPFERPAAGKGQKPRIHRMLPRLLTVFFAFLQAPGYITVLMVYLAPPVPDPALIYWGLVLLLVTGAVLSMWIAERITALGVADGRILLLGAEVFILLPAAFYQEVSNKLEAGNFLGLGLEMICWAGVVIGLIALTQAAREVPVRFKKREGFDPSEEEDGTMLLPFNLVDEYPIAAAGYFLAGPALLYFSLADGEAVAEDYWMAVLFDSNTLAYLALSFMAIVAATYLYVSILAKPKYYSEAMEAQEVRLANTHPGEATTVLRRLIARLTLPLALTLGLTGILPILSLHLFSATAGFHAYFGGFQLFIAISLATDLCAQLGYRRALGEEAPELLLGRNTSPDLLSAPRVVFLLNVTEEEE